MKYASICLGDFYCIAPSLLVFILLPSGSILVNNFHLRQKYIFTISQYVFSFSPNFPSEAGKVYHCDPWDWLPGDNPSSCSYIYFCKKTHCSKNRSTPLPSILRNGCLLSITWRRLEGLFYTEHLWVKKKKKFTKIKIIFNDLCFNPISHQQHDIPSTLPHHPPVSLPAQPSYFMQSNLFPACFSSSNASANLLKQKSIFRIHPS